MIVKIRYIKVEVCFYYVNKLVRQIKSMVTSHRTCTLVVEDEDTRVESER